MNFARDVLEELPAEEVALIELARDGSRREWSFGEVGERSARLAGALAERGIGRGDVVMTLIGNRPEWVLTMIACFRIGAVALPCTEQLRANDLSWRLEVARPALVIADERTRGELEAARPECPVLLVPDEASGWEDERRRLVLLHELAHIRRWDWLTQLLAHVACAVYWFNPLVWLAARQMRIERERACDDLVLSSGARASDYAQELLALAAGLSDSRLSTLVAVPMARRGVLEDRLRLAGEGVRRAGRPPGGPGG